MIRVARGPEPTGLTAKRRQQLSRAILARRSGREVDFSGYEVAKDELAAALNYKCVFCEKDLRIEGSPVEHFRPKAFVQNEGTKVDHSRYWWLAWTWVNLLFACDRCNTGFKRNQFPLAEGALPLPELSHDVDQEQALLIDPARTDPTEHIVFMEDPTVHRWVAVPKKGSEAGRETIRALGLDEDDHLNDHIEERVRKWVEQLEDVVQNGSAPMVQRTWQRMCLSLFAPMQPFHALTRDALAVLVPESTRQRFELQLPTLGKSEVVIACGPFEDPPEFAQIDAESQLMVRSLGDKAEWDEVSAVLVRVLPQATWTDEQLAKLLDRGVGTVRAYLQRFRAALVPATNTPDVSDAG